MNLAAAANTYQQASTLLNIASLTYTVFVLMSLTKDIVRKAIIRRWTQDDLIETQSLRIYNLCVSEGVVFFVAGLAGQVQRGTVSELLGLGFAASGLSIAGYAATKPRPQEPIATTG